MSNSLLDVVKKLPKEPARGSGDGWTKADYDYVSPTAKEIEAEYKEVVAIQELVPPKMYEFPFGAPKKTLVKALEEVDPTDKIPERATLKRLLRAKKVTIPNPSTTAELVHLAMASGCLGRENKKNALSLEKSS